MPIVHYSRAAQADLNEIWCYYAEQVSIDLAESFLDQLESVCEKISYAPLAYRLRLEYHSSMRSFPYKSYIIFYLPADDGIKVVRVLHSARDLNAIFEGGNE